MKKAFKVTFPVTVTVIEDVNWEKPLCGIPLSERDEEGIVSAARDVLDKAVSAGCSPYARDSYFRLRAFSPEMLKDGRIRIQEVDA